MGEAIYVVFLETYFKGDCEDLSHGEYKLLENAADTVLSQPLLFDWE